jgi:hypothetical protein
MPGCRLSGQVTRSVSFYLSSASEPKIAIHRVAAKYAAGDGDAATTEIQWATSAVLTIRPFSGELGSPIDQHRSNNNCIYTFVNFFTPSAWKR